jgi:SAM-dependent methyltransferase
MYIMRPPGSAQVTGLTDFIATLSPETRMVEIGCYRGEATAFFLTRVAHVVCVDPWKDYLEFNNASEPITMTGMDAIEQEFDAVAATTPHRVLKVKLPSLEAAAQFPDGTFDLVYIDGNHGYLDVLEDIAAWLPKVKEGGLLAGHDYDVLARPGVPRAVQESLGMPDAVFQDSTWVKRIGVGAARADGPKPSAEYRRGDIKVLIGIPCHMNSGFQPFEVALDHLIVGRTDVKVFRAMGSVVPGARNRIVREALRLGTEYIWFLDADQPFFPGDPGQPDRLNDLDALMAHGVDAVIPLSSRSGSPYLPLLYSQIQDDGTYAAQRYLDVDDHGLIRIAAAGMAGLLIRTEILLKMGLDGWFEFKHPVDNADDYNEDLSFYKRLQNMGIQLYCDLNVRFGHAITLVSYIVRQQGQWMTVLADKEPVVAFPQPVHPLGLAAQRRQNQTPVLT